MSEPDTHGKKTDEPLPTDKLAGLVASFLEEGQAEDIVVLRMEDVLPITDYFVIATGRTKRHIDALVEIVQKRMKELKIPPMNRSGRDAGKWVLLDYGWVVVHLFAPDEREYYDLEMLWADAEKIPLTSILP